MIPTAPRSAAACRRDWYTRPDCTCGQCDPDDLDARRFQWRILHAQQRGTAVLRRDADGYRITRSTDTGGYECRVMRGADGLWHSPVGADASLRSSLRHASRHLLACRSAAGTR